MYSRLVLTAAFAMLLARTNALPQGTESFLHILDAPSRAFNLTARQDKPAGMTAIAYPGSAFANFETASFGDGHPAVEHAPVFVYSRTGPTVDPCYPEFATVDANTPNPGTCSNDHGCPSANPGADCRNPRNDGVYNGKYTLGDSFPVYVTACFDGSAADNEGGVQWRVNYDAYYVHDGNLEAGHRHDWEGITVLFGKVKGFEGPEFDWWTPTGAIYNQHDDHYYYSWDQLETVDVDVPGNTDVSDRTIGKSRKHPKNYVGFFSHSAHAHVCTPADTPLCTVVNPGKAAAQYEYRGEDWWRLPRAIDLHHGSEIHPDWNYGHATSTPPVNAREMCTSWTTKPGLGQVTGPVSNP